MIERTGPEGARANKGSLRGLSLTKLTWDVERFFWTVPQERTEKKGGAREEKTEIFGRLLGRGNRRARALIFFVVTRLDLGHRRPSPARRRLNSYSFSHS
ncbi:hypothetical protein AVEN_18734-1 [Araneus ventricosus]|uniref:Uncharacterized protein n=1 Tax=Araneus ventricosus TaxID=182803 RepID=A0A4Y2GK15_ARAVE|nr:hypothetical protein AVEN_18734-1 [Araneus ventricosus]